MVSNFFSHYVDEVVVSTPNSRGSIKATSHSSRSLLNF